MAEYLIQDTTLTNIADAIRAKEGTTDNISVNDMANRISAIETGGTPVISVNSSGLITATAGNKSATAQLNSSMDADFIARNIKSGASIFGVSGELPVWNDYWVHRHIISSHSSLSTEEKLYFNINDINIDKCAYIRFKILGERDSSYCIQYGFVKPAVEKDTSAYETPPLLDYSNVDVSGWNEQIGVTIQAYYEYRSNSYVGNYFVFDASNSSITFSYDDVNGYGYSCEFWEISTEHPS